MRSLFNRIFLRVLYFFCGAFIFVHGYGLSQPYEARADEARADEARTDEARTDEARTDEARTGDNSSAVILNYYRFGDSGPLNIRLDQFEDHISFLASPLIHTKTLNDVLTALDNPQQKLDKGSVVVSISNAFISTYLHGWPRLKAKSIPLIIFIPTSVIGAPGYMNWQQLREMVADGVEVGTFGSTMNNIAFVESDQDIKRMLEQARSLIAEKTGQLPRYFAYPMGIASARLQRIVREAGFIAAVGQHAGTIDKHSDRFYLSRFFINEQLSDMTYFRHITQVQGLGVIGIDPIAPMIGEAQRIDTITITQAPDFPPLQNIDCYHSVQGKVITEPNYESNQWRIFLASPLPRGRSRINCLAASAGIRYWYGYQYFVR